MKSSEDILRFIEQWCTHALARPQMYASSAQSLEETLWFMDLVREYILSEDGDVVLRPERYADFLSANGFGVKSFTSRYYPSKPHSEQDKQAFMDLAAFWGKYMATWKAR